MKSGRFRVFCLWFSDVLCITSAWAIVVFGYKIVGFGRYDMLSYLKAWPIIFIFTGINLIAKLYHGRGTYPSMPLPPVEEFRRLVLSAISTHVLVMAVLGFSRDAELISRFVLTVAGVLTAIFGQLYRNLVRTGLKHFGLGQIPAFVIGDGNAADALRQRLTTDAYYGFEVIKVFTAEDTRDILKVAEALKVKHLFCVYKDIRHFQRMFNSFIEHFYFIEYIPSEYNFPIADARPMQVGGLGGVEMVNQRRMKLLSFEKSCVDRVLAFLIFLLAIPCFIVIPILIKLTSKGPVFYLAKRLGKGGIMINVWKFRSMYNDADKQQEEILATDPALKREFESGFKLKNDPRVTPIGKFLRKTSIDELPQLINVFRGEMALVGPRPIVEREVGYYGPNYATFSLVKPGITGLWQVSGRSDCDYPERVAMDVHYILNWSPWMDFWIVFRTVIAVLRMKGSY